MPQVRLSLAHPSLNDPTIHVQPVWSLLRARYPKKVLQLVTASTVQLRLLSHPRCRQGKIVRAAELCSPCMVAILGGPWDLGATHNWAYNPTSSPSNWPYLFNYPNYEPPSTGRWSSVLLSAFGSPVPLASQRKPTSLYVAAYSLGRFRAWNIKSQKNCGLWSTVRVSGLSMPPPPQAVCEGQRLRSKNNASCSSRGRQYFMVPCLRFVRERRLWGRLLFGWIGAKFVTVVVLQRPSRMDALINARMEEGSQILLAGRPAEPYRSREPEFLSGSGERSCVFLGG